MKAMIMAAGLGTRLYPLTRETAKPMVPILNRPVMEHMLKLLRSHGIHDVAANLHHYPEEIRGHFGDGARFGVGLRYNLEQELLGTAGGVGEFRDFFADGTFLVVSGDGLTDIDLTAFLAAHRASGALATMAVKKVDDPSHYGVVVHGDDFAVRRFQEKPRREEADSDLCNTGIYAFEPGIFEYVPPRRFIDWANDVFPALLADGVPFRVWRLHGYWNDVGSMEQYRAGNFDALIGKVRLDIPGRELRPGVWVGEGALIEPEATLRPPLLIGAGCLVESGAELVGPLIVGDGCIIERGAKLEGVIHWNGVKAGRNSHVAGSILGRNVVVHHDAIVHPDAVLGDRCDVSPSAQVPSEARVEPRSRVGQDGVTEPDPTS